MSKPLIVIPARTGSTRLKNKPLREIGGVPLITHVCRRALEADVGHVVLSTDDERVAAARPDGVFPVVESGFKEHCGTDRVAHATNLLNTDTLGIGFPGYDYIINLQGDLPFIDPQIIRDLWVKRQVSRADIVTACTLMHWVSGPKIWERCSEYAHIGVYAYTTASLRRFASFPVSKYELSERLEQLRADDNGMTFDTIHVDHMPLEINTESDLAHANLIASMLRRAEDTGTRHPGLDQPAFWNEGGD